MNTKMPYSFLRGVFSQFLEDKYKDNGQSGAMRSAIATYQKPVDGQAEHILSRLNVSHEVFYERYLTPWSNLSEVELVDVVHHWNVINAPERRLVMTLQPTNDNIARHWTFVNIVELNLFNPFIKKWPEGLPKRRPPKVDWLTARYGGHEYAMPYKQCHYCGRTNSDPRGRLFGKQDLKYCHQKECPTADANPATHAVDCCYAQWNRMKRNVLKQCHRAKGNKALLASHFLEFCQERYESNLAMVVRVQTAKVKPTDWINVDDYLSFVPHELL
jgi:hypothetical protein